MGRWNYRLVYGDPSDPTDLLNALDQADAGGWEAVGFSISADGFHVALIRQRKADPQTPSERPALSRQGRR